MPSGLAGHLQSFFTLDSTCRSFLLSALTFFTLSCKPQFIHFSWSIASRWASRWLSSKESACRAGAESAKGSVIESGRVPAGGQGNPLQYFYLENPMGRGALWATIHRVSKTEVTEVHGVGHESSDLARGKYNCFTVLCVFLLYGKVSQLYVYI